MIYNYVIQPAAQEEYVGSIEWYAERSETATLNFIAEVSKGIDKICADPYRYKSDYNDFRELVLKKFPFNLVYRIDEDKQLVIIVAIYHQNRFPKKKYR